MLSACFFAFCISLAGHQQAGWAQKSEIIQQTYKRLQLIAQASLKADQKLLLQLDDTKKRLALLVRKRSFPSLQTDIDEIQLKLNENLEENPYISKEFEVESGVSSLELPVNRNKARILVKLDPSISESLVQTWGEHPPKSLDKPAGTICVLTNGFDLALLYVSSIEGGPCKDPKTGKARILSLRATPDPEMDSGNSPARD
ncbi:MAG: hypothetical protein SFY67_08365 [Candidatus Melainabacteria bacterium]|nr:hypothetical protein [Candidatus Melainabacteria bacterium]